MDPVDNNELDIEEVQHKETMSKWMREHWRPLMAMQYLVVCVFDFIIAPVCWTVFQAQHHEAMTQWIPTTLGSGGTYHLAMGAVLGVAAWTRSMDKENDMMRGAYMNGQRSNYQGTAWRSTTATTRETTTQMPLPDADLAPPRKPLPGME